MLATQTSSKKCLTYGCFLTKVFQCFVVNLVGIGDHIGIGKIYNKHTFKRMGFSRNEEGILVRGGQEDGDESDEEEEEEEDEGQDAMNVDERKGDEVRSKRKRRRQLRQCGFPRKKKGSLKNDLQRSKRTLKITRLYEVIKLKTLMTRRMVKDSFIRRNFFEKLSLKN
ncbi:hypothetical protein M9H77_31495 [Catharanthus roseus]|uniref:Uncharacterized protein n=1 Tax=Catharanthus roseus TaxID=4058 RepID=A0ACC0A4H8_CATRO|nr:hypothetical protein M9H77_31495 [Catharanthus roseus]